ncbi:MAG: ABC transporter permease subunit [Myxococcota bacterium]
MSAEDTRDPAQSRGESPAAPAAPDALSDNTVDTAAATIHDTGYQRYDGERTAQAGRYRVIVGNVVRQSWRGLWRMKLWAITTVITLVVFGAIMFVQPGFKDRLILESLNWFSLSAFFLTLSAVASLVADDMRSGAFVFYFSRPIRPRDYVLGKLLGAVLITGVTLFLGPVLLAVLQLGLSSGGDLAGNVPLVFKTALIAVVGTVVYAALALACSAVTSRGRLTVALWGGAYLVLANAALGVAESTGIAEVAALHPLQSLKAVAGALLGAGGGGAPVPPLWLAGVALLVYALGSVAFVQWRVHAAADIGLGGSS